TARSSIQWSGFGTICAATGSPTRCFVAWPTSWTPARRRGTGSPPTPAWSARSARSPGLRLRPLYSWRLLCGLRSKTHSCPEICGDPYYQFTARFDGADPAPAHPKFEKLTVVKAALGGCVIAADMGRESHVRRYPMKSDNEIKRDVEEELRWEPNVDPTDIAVAVKNGVVTLTGFVRSYAHKLAAERAAKRVA